MVKKQNILLKKKSNRTKLCKTDKVIMAFVYTFVILMFALFAFPLIYVLACSFSSGKSILLGKVFLLPNEFTFENYKYLFEDGTIWKGLRNSALYTIVGTTLSVIFTMMAGYALSQKSIAKNIVMKIFIVTLYFGGGLVPSFILVNNLGMYNRVSSLIIPSLISVWNIILVKTYFQSSLSTEIIESAKIDGCNSIQLFCKVALPLSIPIMVVIALYYGVGKWNSYFEAMIFLRNEEYYPLQLIIKNLLITVESSPGSSSAIDINTIYRAEAVKYCAIVISVLPMAIVFPFAQKYFKRGIMLGSMKG